MKHVIFTLIVVANFGTAFSQTVTDIDGNIYNTVQIGSQVWMAENLKTTHYQNGDPIPHIPIANQWFDLNSGAYCFLQNDSNYIPLYGNLYNGFVVLDSRKVCPTNWHIPTESDWNNLISYLAGDSIAGGKMKEMGTIHWTSPNVNATNSSGFLALPGGSRNNSSTLGYSGEGIAALFWAQNISAYFLSFNTEDIEHGGGNVKLGFSIRCMSDVTTEIDESNNLDEINVFPNPIGNELNIITQKALQEVLIYDVNGRLILGLNANSKNNLQLNLSDFEPGIYLLKTVDFNGSRTVFKIVKK